MNYRDLLSECFSLLSAGLSTGHYAWAFHSEAEEELLNMLPALQKGEPTWPELRAMGVGWWLRSTDKLRRCIEKVRQLINCLYILYIFRSVHTRNIQSSMF